MKAAHLVSHRMSNRLSMLDARAFQIKTNTGLAGADAVAASVCCCCIDFAMANLQAQLVGR